MDLQNTIFSGLGGAVVSAVVSYAIYRHGMPKPSGRAWEILKGMRKALGKQEGEVYYTRSGEDNYRVASYLWANVDGHVVATAFNEDPATYGENDLLRTFQYGGSLITRITCAEACPPHSQQIASTVLGKIQRGASFVVVPGGERYVRLDGIFCRFHDGSHLCLIAFRNPTDSARNTGVVFRDGMARSFYEYYESLARQFS